MKKEYRLISGALGTNDGHDFSAWADVFWTKKNVRKQNGAIKTLKYAKMLKDALKAQDKSFGISRTYRIEFESKTEKGVVKGEWA